MIPPRATLVKPFHIRCSRSHYRFACCSALGYTIFIHSNITNRYKGLEVIMQTPQRVIVVHSPHSGRSSKLSEALTYLEQAGLEIVNTISIADLDNLPAQGITWKESGIDIAISGGGDGLVGGVITHIAESGLPLGILPLGTSNDIARSLHIPQDIGEAAQVIAQGNEQEVDVGTAQSAEHAAHPGTSSQSVVASTQEGSHPYAYFAHALTVGSSFNLH